MAHCIPEPKFAQSNSRAELALFRALGSQLNSEFLVLHSVAWISRPSGSGPRDGEADLLIVHPRLGILVIEVKGGRISKHPTRAEWTSMDARGAVHTIKDPFEQAKRAKYSILEKLKESPIWKKLRIGRLNIGHASFFPDIGDAGRLCGPAAPNEISGDSNDMKALADWVQAAFTFWAGKKVGQFDPPGAGGVEAITKIFARAVTTRPLLSARIRQEEVQRLELTKRQTMILDLLKRQRRVMISGGAGTGKTLIAREKALRLAEEGMDVLLVCYNRGLADHLREQCEGVARLDVASFHQVCSRWVRRVQVDFGVDLISEARRDYPGEDMYDILMPIALANAVDRCGGSYDAIVVDEAQDFGDEFWLPIEMLLSDLENGLLYVFLDENQDIYNRSASIPIAGEPMILDRNCRNTAAIHHAAYHHYRGAEVTVSEIAGVSVEPLCANGIDNQAKLVTATLTRLVAEEGVAPHEIAVLLCGGRQKTAFEDVLRNGKIPRSICLGHLEDYGPGVVTVETVARFKGLEREVVILWDVDGCTPKLDRETLYVGLSRAKSVLYVCGSKEANQRILS